MRTSYFFSAAGIAHRGYADGKRGRQCGFEVDPMLPFLVLMKQAVLLFYEWDMYYWKPAWIIDVLFLFDFKWLV